ncbi:MAG: hypothetical protein ACI4U0_02785 [Candidatus Aphodocola sp.]
MEEKKFKENRAKVEEILSNILFLSREIAIYQEGTADEKMDNIESLVADLNKILKSMSQDERDKILSGEFNLIRTADFKVKSLPIPATIGMEIAYQLLKNKDFYHEKNAAQSKKVCEKLLNISRITKNLPYDAMFDKSAELSTELASKIKGGKMIIFVPMKIGKTKSIGVQVIGYFSPGVSLDGDRMQFDDNDSPNYSEIEPLYEKDSLKLNKENNKKALKQLEMIDTIGEKYFDNGIFPRDTDGWKLHLKTDEVSYELRDCLEKIVEKLMEADILQLDKTKTAIHLQGVITKFLKTEKQYQTEKENSERAYKAHEIKNKFNDIARKYFKTGWPSEFSFERELKDPNIPSQLKEILYRMVITMHKLSGATPVKYYFELEPLINELYDKEVELSITKENLSNNKELSDAKETYKKKSLLERIKQILKSKTNNEPNDSMKM